jgi:hypothetical protein
MHNRRHWYKKDKLAQTTPHTQTYTYINIDTRARQQKNWSTHTDIDVQADTLMTTCVGPVRDQAGITYRRACSVDRENMLRPRGEGADMAAEDGMPVEATPAVGDPRDRTYPLSSQQQRARPTTNRSAAKRDAHKSNAGAWPPISAA